MKAVIIRTGFSTHGMNMGQRYLQLFVVNHSSNHARGAIILYFYRNSTASSNHDDSITIHISQVPPNPALFAPGPAFLYIVVNGVPSIGEQVMIGNGIGTQTKNPVQSLPVA